MKFEEVEQARITYHEKSKKYWSRVGIIVGTIFAVSLITVLIQKSFFLLMLPFFFTFFALVIGAVVISFLTSKDALAYQKAYKSYFVEKNLQTVFTNLEYAHGKGLSKDYLKATNMVNTGDRFSSNDFTKGHYKDVLFVQSDVHIEEEHTDSDGNTTYVTIFRGRFMVFEFPKKFSFKLELIGKRFGAYSIPGKNQQTGRKMQKISTESGEFNSAFRIFGEDGFEAFYILDPAFMVKILNISEQHKNRVLLGFYDNKLLIGLNDGKDSFEPPKASQPINEAEETKKVSTDIKTITDFVDQLSLHRKLFK